MQIIIELTDEEAAAIEAEIDTFPVYEEAVRMTIADYLKDYSQPNLTRLVSDYAKRARGTAFEETIVGLKAIPADKQEEALAEIAAVIEKHRKEDVKQAPPREQRGE